MKRLQPQPQKELSVVYNAHPEDGISSSLKLGLAANMEADACFLQWLISPGCVQIR